MIGILHAVDSNEDVGKVYMRYNDNGKMRFALGNVHRKAVCVRRFSKDQTD
jgi:hypothetical protein